MRPHWVGSFKSENVPNFLSEPTRNEDKLERAPNFHVEDEETPETP